MPVVCCKHVQHENIVNKSPGRRTKQPLRLQQQFLCANLQYPDEITHRGKDESWAETGHTWYSDLIKNLVLLMMHLQIGEDVFLFQHDSVPMHESWTIKKWFVDTEHDWPRQSSDREPIHLWDKSGSLHNRQSCGQPYHGNKKCTSLFNSMSFIYQGLNNW